MLQEEIHGKSSIVIAIISVLMFFVANMQIANAAESGCVTCHLDKEMLQKNVTVEQGQKSALQSGAG